MRSQPTGTVTLVFTDIEGSTKLLSELGQEGYRQALADQRRAVRGAFGGRGGYEVDYEGDSFFYSFAAAADAVRAVEDAMAALAEGPIQIRVGIHTGEPGLDPPKYVGLDVHKAARIMAAGHGGQVLLSQTTKDLVGSAFAVKALGAHRLKDLGAPEPLYQLGGWSFPPLATLRRTNLPTPSTPFLGRERELGEVTELLQGGTRILTLVGPGGAGKTRLAAQAAAAAADGFPGGLWFVQLAAVRDPGLVFAEVAQAIGLVEEPGRDVAETIADALRAARSLLLIDNAEHLLPEIAASVEALRDADGAAVLVTSRERLQLQGELVYPVPPLVDEEAVALFVARARALETGFEPSDAVAELCARLDRLPLAIELAAARTAALTPEGILGRLSKRLDLLKAGRGAEPRQETLRATIEWSHDLLDAAERALFARLAVFEGGCTLEAAEQVCDAELDTLASLVDKSLVRHTGGRYWMLETIREYAAERFEAAGDVEMSRDRHAAWMLELAERDDHVLYLVTDDDVADRVDAEHENGRAAIHWLLERDPVAALRLAAALAIVWQARGRFSEGRTLLESVFARVANAPPGVLAKGHVRAAQFAFEQGEVEEARTRFEQARCLFDEAGDRAGSIYTVTELATILRERGELDAARASALSAVEQARALEDPLSMSFSTCLHAQLLELGGDYVSGRQAHVEATRLARAAGYPVPIRRAVGALGWNALLAGEYDAAREALAEILARLSPRDLRERLVVGTNLAWAELFLGNYSEACEQLLEGLRIARDIRHKRIAAEALIAFAAARAAGGGGGEASVGALWGAGRTLLEDSGGTATTIEERAEQRWLVPIEQECRTAYERGTALSFEEAIELALPV